MFAMPQSYPYLGGGDPLYADSQYRTLDQNPSSVYLNPTSSGSPDMLSNFLSLLLNQNFRNSGNQSFNNFQANIPIFNFNFGRTPPYFQPPQQQPQYFGGPQNPFPMPSPYSNPYPNPAPHYANPFPPQNPNPYGPPGYPPSQTDFKQRVLSGEPFRVNFFRAFNDLENGYQGERDPLDTLVAGFGYDVRLEPNGAFLTRGFDESVERFHSQATTGGDFLRNNEINLWRKEFKLEDINGQIFVRHPSLGIVGTANFLGGA